MNFLLKAKDDEQLKEIQSLMQRVAPGAVIIEKGTISFKEMTGEKCNEFNKKFPFVPWGDDNKFPYRLKEEARKSNTTLAVLDKITKLTYAMGPWAYTENEKGEKVKSTDKFSKDFMKRNSVAKHLFRILYDRYTYGLAWVVFIVKKVEGKNVIKGLRTIQAPHGRFARPNTNTNKLDRIYVSKNWEHDVHTLIIDNAELTNEASKWISKYTLLPEIKDDAINVMLAADIKDGQQQEFVYCLKQYDSGNDYYPDMPWHACYYNDWVTISGNIPKILSRLFFLSVLIKQLVYIDDALIEAYIQQKTNNAPEITPEQRDQHVKALQDDIDKYLAGKDNTFKSLFTTMKYDDSGNVRKSIVVEVIQNNLKDGQIIIPNSQQADSNIITSIGLTSSQFELLQPGGKNPGGSGSNLREAHLAFLATAQPMRDEVTEILEMVKDFNILTKGEMWADNVEFGFKDMIIETLNENKNGASTGTTK